MRRWLAGCLVVGVFAALGAGGAVTAGADNVPDTTVPSIHVTTPAEGQQFLLNSTVPSSFSCSDNIGGSGIASCVGPNGVNTSSTGAHTFTVTAIDNAGNTVQKTVNYTVVADTSAPGIVIFQPTEGEHFPQFSTQFGSYVCGDGTGGSGIVSCSGPTNIDTSTLGAHTYTVTAVDAVGNQSSKTVNYVVDPADTAPPTIGVLVPAEGQHFKHNDAIASKFACTDDSGVSGIALCQGAPTVDTSTVGEHSFVVFAADRAGNVATATVHYVVNPDDTTPPAAGINTPAEGAHYLQGTALASVFACADELGGSGIASCTAPAAVDTAAPGDHTFTLTAIDFSGNATTRTVHYVVDPAPDTTPPSITVLIPSPGQHFVQGSTVPTGFSCADNPGGGGIATCVGPAALDTSTVGSHTITFAASDKAGNTAGAAVNYVVDARTIITIPTIFPTIPSGPTKAQLTSAALTDLYGGSSLTMSSSGSRSLLFAAPEAGTLTVRWKSGKTTVATTSKSFGQAATKRLTLKLTAAGKRLLKSKSNHKLSVTSTATFAADSGNVQTKTNKLTIKRAS